MQSLFFFFSCVCECIYECVCMCVCMHVCLPVCACTSVSACGACTSVSACVCVYECVCMCAHTCLLSCLLMVTQYPAWPLPGLGAGPAIPAPCSCCNNSACTFPCLWSQGHTVFEYSRLHVPTIQFVCLLHGRLI